MKSLITFLIIISALVCNLHGQWYEQTSGITQSLYSIHFLNANLGWACGANGKIIKTTDGENWSTLNSGVTENLTTIQFVNENTGWVYGWNQLFLKTTNGGTTWNHVTFSYSVNSFYFVSSNVGWVSSRNNNVGEIYKTTNGGLNWTLQFVSIDFYPESFFFLNENYGWAGTPLIKTSDGGNNWIPNYNSPWGSPSSLSFADTLTGWFSYNTLGSYAISKTTDGGTTWTEQIAESGKSIESISFINANVGYAAGYKMGMPNNPERGIIKKTTDGGLTWIEQYSDTGGLYSIYMIDEMVGYAAGYPGKILKTINGGLPVELISFSAECVDNDVILSWTTASETNNKGFQVERSIKNSKLQIKNFETMGFVNGNGTSTELNHYSFTDENLSAGKYIYRLKQIDYDGSFEYSNEIEVDVNVVNEFVLYQNYPNPFNPSTNIKFTIPDFGFTTLKIYDVLGNEVATLVNEEKHPGEYEIEFDASKLSSGIYFYNLTFGTYTSSKKLLLIK
jgi:photosystem II stability/assembly factor-like uncharacterized protein